MEIGAKIKRLRLKNSLTLEELASRTELSKGFLSQLERDLSSPSIATLSDILEVLGSDFKSFFENDDSQKIVYKEKDYFLDQQNDYSIVWLVSDAQKHSMEPMIIELKKGKSSMVIKPHEGEEFGYVLSGEIEIVFEGKREVVKENETFYLFKNKEHYLVNKSQTVSKVMWISNPPIF